MIVYGASGHAKVVLDILETCGKKVDFIVDDNPDLYQLLGYPVKRNTGSYDEAIIAIGSSSIRKKIVESLKVRKYPAHEVILLMKRTVKHSKQKKKPARMMRPARDNWF